MDLHSVFIYFYPETLSMLRNRSILEDIRNHISNKQYTIITGARQVGKTSLIRLLYQELSNAHESIFFLNLEDRRILDAVNVHPENILNFIPIKPSPILSQVQERPILLLLDEVQYLTNPTNFLKYLYDTYEGNLKIIATGSSAFYIDRKFKDSLAGRKRIFPLYPLSFDEFLSFRDEQALLTEISYLRSQDSYQSIQIDRIKSYLNEFLQFGGYPAVVLEDKEPEKKAILMELKNAYLKRDILESGVEKEQKFYLLLQLLADQTGKLVNKQELSNTLGIDSKTIDQYVYILQKCFHIYLLRPFFRNLRKELTKMPKVFFNDLGLRNAFLNRFSPVDTRADRGELLENFYFLQFRQVYNPDQIKFWRTTERQEVDFIIEESFGEGKAYEIKWNPSSFTIGKYKKFTQTYPNFPLTCLSAQDFYLISEDLR